MPFPADALNFSLAGDGVVIVLVKSRRGGRGSGRCCELEEIADGLVDNGNSTALVVVVVVVVARDGNSVVFGRGNRGGGGTDGGSGSSSGVWRWFIV